MIDRSVFVDERVEDLTHEDLALMMSAWDIDLKCDDPKHSHAIACYTCQDRMEKWWEAVREAARTKTRLPYIKRIE